MTAELAVYDDVDLDDTDQEIESLSQKLVRKLDALGQKMAVTRSEAIEAREASGIEQEWIEDEEFYEGIDDANRGEMTAWRGKPLGMPGGTPSQESTGSTIFPNITRPYVDGAAARTTDMLIPVDDRSWAINHTPIPSLIGISEGRMPRGVESEITRAMGGDSAKAETEIARIVEIAKEAVAKAREAAEKAEKRIQDWHVEGQYHSELRAVIEDAAKIGTGILKGPIPDKKRVVAYKNGKLLIAENVIPVSRRIDYWNFYPDGGCGENIHNGSYTWERDDITRKALSKLRGDPGYIKSQIDECLKEGACRVRKIVDRNDISTGLIERESKNLFEIWYFYGQVSKGELRACEIMCGDDADNDDISRIDDADEIDVHLTMVNNRVIKAILNPLETSEFPYDLMVWQLRKGSPFGCGVARHIRTPQRIVIGGARAMMDNAGRAAGPQTIFDPEIIQPSNGRFEIVPFKTWEVTKSLEPNADPDSAFRFVKIDMMQPELQAIINFGLKLAEDVTGMPLIMQGQTNQSTPTTLGGMQIQNNNASTVLRRIARNFDDLVTEPHIRRYYAYLLQHGPDDSEKGDFTVDARGSSALIERDMQNQWLAQMASIVKDPVFKLDPAKWVRETLKGQRFDINRFEYDDDEWQKIVEQLSQPPQDSSVQVAQLRVDAQMQIEAMRKEMREYIESIKLQDRERERSHESQENALNRELSLALEQMGEDIKAIELGSRKQTNLDSIKSRLAETVMKLQTQVKLANQQANAAPQVTKPPTEPPGRAKNGMAYQQ
jgi:hypothetical protein